MTNDTKDNQGYPSDMYLLQAMDYCNVIYQLVNHSIFDILQMRIIRQNVYKFEELFQDLYSVK